MQADIYKISDTPFGLKKFDLVTIIPNIEKTPDGTFQISLEPLFRKPPLVSAAVRPPGFVPQPSLADGSRNSSPG